MQTNVSVCLSPDETSFLYILTWVNDSFGLHLLLIFGLCLLIIFMRDRYVHYPNHPTLIYWLWLLTVLGCLLMIFMRDCYVCNSRHLLLVLHRRRCCKTVFPPVCCHNKYTVGRLFFVGYKFREFRDLESNSRKIRL